MVAEGPVGLRWLGRSRFFRYKMRRWRNGTIPNVARAVGAPRKIETDRERVARLLALVPDVPAVTWAWMSSEQEEVELELPDLLVAGDERS